MGRSWPHYEGEELAPSCTFGATSPFHGEAFSSSNKETRRRLQRTPPRPGSHRVTRFWFLRRFTAVAYLWRPTFARTVGGPGRRTNCLHSATIRCQCQGLWRFSRLLHLR